MIKTKHNSNHKTHQTTLKGEIIQEYSYYVLGFVPVNEVRLKKDVQSLIKSKDFFQNFSGLKEFITKIEFSWIGFLMELRSILMKLRSLQYSIDMIKLAIIYEICLILKKLPVGARRSLPFILMQTSKLEKPSKYSTNHSNALEL